ncbi:type II secretion system protein [bacterium]|nr:type II secretion system protein [bacterium]
MKKHLAFTLTELLMALTIVGVLAVLTVPILINNFQNRLFATQIKNFSAEIEQFAQDQLITHKTRDLMDTDFGEPSKLLTDGHFSIVKICTADKSLKDCWKISATGKDKVTYKRLNGKTQSTWGNCAPTIVLKNGVMFCYGTMDNNLRIIVDVNGNDKPNIDGRDLFAFYLTPKGHVVDYDYILNSGSDINTKISNCRTEKTHSPQWCYSALISNNWKMDY